MTSAEIRNVADEALIGIEDPVIRQALEQAARERITAQVSRTEQAAGLTGAAQVQAGAGLFARALGEAVQQGNAREAQQRQRILELRLNAATEASKLDQQAYQFERRLQFELQQAKRQEDMLQKQALIGAVGGIATGFVGTDLFASFFGSGA